MVRVSHHIDFLVALSIVIVAAVFSLLIYSHTIRLSFFVGSLRFSHLLSIVGSVGIAIVTPIFVLLKRSFSLAYTKITRLHVFGNLIFFGLIAIHFASQMSRANLPELGSGLGMFIAMVAQVTLGFTQRFRSHRALYKKIFNLSANKFLHAGLVMVFYAVILFHVLHGFDIT